MNRHIKTILRDLGLFLYVPGAMALVSIPIAILLGEYYAILPFFWTALASLAAGQGLYCLFRHAEASRLPHALLTVALWGFRFYSGWVKTDSDRIFVQRDSVALSTHYPQTPSDDAL